MLSREVYKILVIRNAADGADGEVTVVVIENKVEEQQKDRLTVTKIQEGRVEVVKQIQVPKAYSVCISARKHHSGH